ncbi:hypothetical protein P344_02000 [Spiroplasma mirum ATCC 29335]|uniref:Lipoprotein n=1 Tax=Spiroplasma mirum ATCC 29335 TaxID=838561 RepID=W0GQG8_9MOLU|nr:MULTISPECIES: hypothetical protein [Spiroplasma]AHF60786.1 putative lipoprotein [Spiroplasma mirum ATCC 29335]AHI57748.1 hypothetical protein P344_02000 [Spiroplasma mirum ATCC 29335]AKM52900.1 hypothetical protein SATRI_v1c03790 [Spiroplasma atrichopogonis]
MKRLLAILTATMLATSLVPTLVACGNSHSDIIDGKKNVSTEFTLTNSVYVSSETKDINADILAAAKKEGRIEQGLDLQMGDITDQENNILPPNIGDQETGYIVFTLKDKPEISYTGSITIYFTLINSSPVDISQDVDLSLTLKDVTKYDDLTTLQNEIWDEAKTQFTANTPDDISGYDLLGLALPTKFNQVLSEQLIAKYNGKFDSGIKKYKGTITIKLNIISYYINLPLELKNDVGDNDTLYQFIWQHVKNSPEFSTDPRVSATYKDYDIDFSSVVEPGRGQSTNFKFLATPKDESVNHYLRVEGNLTKDHYTMPKDISLAVPIIVYEKDRYQVDKAKVWSDAMAIAGLPVTPAMKDFDLSGWDSVIRNNWPNIGTKHAITLVAKNNNTNHVFKGDTTIYAIIMNDGVVKTINTGPILLSSTSKPTVNSIFVSTWYYAVGKFGGEISTKLTDYVDSKGNSTIDKSGLEAAYNQAVATKGWTDYAIKVRGDARTTGKDADLTITGKLRIIDNPLTKSVPINYSTRDYKFNQDPATIDRQIKTLNTRIWNDIIGFSSFNNEAYTLYGVSKKLSAWDSDYEQKVAVAIKNFTPGGNSNIPLELKFKLKDQNIYAGEITVQITLKYDSNRIPMNPSGDSIDATANRPLVFYLDNLNIQNPKEYIRNLMITIWHNAITYNYELQKKYPNLLLPTSNYNYWDDEVVSRVVLPTVDNPVSDITLDNIIPKYNGLYEGTVIIKIKIIYDINHCP